jgi:HPt (histidine-containing phosphotransfer) domain-containing protein
MKKSDQVSDVLDLSALDRLRETVGGDDAFLAELIHTFLEDGPRELARMHQALESQDAELLQRAAHSLKSNSAEFGAQDLRQMCKQLEEMAKQGVFDGASQRVAEIEAEYERVDGALRQFIKAS